MSTPQSISKTKDSSGLCTFEGTLLWPKDIQTRMAEAHTKAQVFSVFKKLTDGANRMMDSLLYKITTTLKDDNLDEAIQQLNSKSENIDHLSEWIGLIQDAGISHVPIEKGPLVTAADIENTHQALHDGDSSKIPANVLENVLPWIKTQQERGWMWRFEFCATETIKKVLGTIRPPNYLESEKIRVPFSTDERVLHCLWGTGCKPSHLIARPWEKAEFEKGFPVEFRVFRTKDGWAACNYYVQRPLPEKYLPIMEQAVELAKKLEAHCKAAGKHIPSIYTTDWILSKSGELKFLEAGPGFNLNGPGAHPCCFNPYIEMTGRRLLATEEGGITWCPPEIQTAVDRIKNGEHPLKVCNEVGTSISMTLQHTAIQGHMVSQEILEQIEQNRFLEWEKESGCPEPLPDKISPE